MVVSNKFLDIVNWNCVYVIKADEINVTFISKLKEITLSHYMEQPRTTLCRKLEKIFFDEDFGVFDYNFYPNCFRHIR